MRVLLASAVFACALAALPASAQKKGVCHESGSTVQGAEASLPEALAAAIEAARQAPKFLFDPNDVLWCTTGEDPRCQPVSGTHSVQVLSRPLAVLTPMLGISENFALLIPFPPEEAIDLERDGFCAPLDRPPQS